MITEFKHLDEHEKDVMLSLPVYVAVLVAGADGTIDNNEIQKSISMANNKSKKARKHLLDYYGVVNENYEDKIKMAIAHLPSGVVEREKVIVEKLEEANNVFPKLDQVFAIKLYASLKDVAKKVAEASGGIFGYMSVGYDESKVVDLKMLKDPSK